MENLNSESLHGFVHKHKRNQPNRPTSPTKPTPHPQQSQHPGQLIRGAGMRTPASQPGFWCGTVVWGVWLRQRYARFFQVYVQVVFGYSSQQGGRQARYGGIVHEHIHTCGQTRATRRNNIVHTTHRPRKTHRDQRVAAQREVER